MIGRIKKHLSPGLVLGMIALIVALGGTSVALEAKSAKKGTLRTRFGGATQEVVQTVALLPQAVNNGVSDHTVTCPSNPTLGAGVGIAGGVVDPRAPDNTRNLAPLEEKTAGPVAGGWLFQFDNDTNEALPVQLRVLCTFSKLNTKRG